MNISQSHWGKAQCQLLPLLPVGQTPPVPALCVSEWGRWGLFWVFVAKKVCNPTRTAQSLLAASAQT